MRSGRRARGVAGAPRPGQREWGHRHRAGDTHRDRPRYDGNTRELGTGTGPGRAPGCAPRGPGSTVWAWGHRDWPHVSQPHRPRRIHTGFPALPHANTLSPGRPSAPPQPGPGLASPFLENPQALPGPGAHGSAADPAPSFHPGTGLWQPGSHFIFMCQISVVQRPEPR